MTRTISDDALATLTTRFAAAPTDMGDVVVGVHPHDDGPIDVEVLGATVDDMLGATAPLRWQGIVVATTRPDPASDDGDSVRMALSVGRTRAVSVQIGRGAVVSTVGESAAGNALDLARRVLGLDTPPAGVSVDDVLLALWLDKVVAMALEDGAGLQRAEVVAAHPLAAEVGPDPLALVLARSEVPVTWESLRREVVAGRHRWLDVAPAVAAWFDAGSFARWVASFVPELAELTETVRALVPVDSRAVLADPALAGRTLSAAQTGGDPVREQRGECLPGEGVEGLPVVDRTPDRGGVHE
jgi:hypothetical protein